MKLTKSQLKKIIREELLKESQDIDKMADEIVTGASYYARKIRNYISLDGDVWGGMSNGQKKYEGTWKDGKLISRKDWNEDGSVKND